MKLKIKPIIHGAIAVIANAILSAIAGIGIGIPIFFVFLLLFLFSSSLFNWFNDVEKEIDKAISISFMIAGTVAFIVGAYVMICLHKSKLKEKHSSPPGIS